jgi:hypothetical protein
LFIFFPRTSRSLRISTNPEISGYKSMIVVA